MVVAGGMEAVVGGISVVEAVGITAMNTIGIRPVEAAMTAEETGTTAEETGMTGVEATMTTVEAALVLIAAKVANIAAAADRVAPPF